MMYLLQVSVCWIGFYCIYALFLRKETFFSINRYYLLGSLILGLIIPFLGGLFPANNASIEVYQMMSSMTIAEITPAIGVEHETQRFSWSSLLWSVYLVGGLVVLSRFIYGMSRIYTIHKNAEKTDRAGYILVESEKLHLPFSFFHWVFISKKLPLNEDIEKIMKHEELHVSQWMGNFVPQEY